METDKIAIYAQRVSLEVPYNGCIKINLMRLSRLKLAKLLMWMDVPNGLYQAEGGL